MTNLLSHTGVLLELSRVTYNLQEPLEDSHLDWLSQGSSFPSSLCNLFALLRSNQDPPTSTAASHSITILHTHPDQNPAQSLGVNFSSATTMMLLTFLPCGEPVRIRILLPDIHYFQ
ncbi:hypothetical protein ILYODFUR_014188 [Ilyodon furcidens]|uniref:Uncharacterized protein n=1 Tax=Ilyodon furcidens TaxID=33524 RepID=A0ABV0T7Y6_9TELE